MRQLVVKSVSKVVIGMDNVKILLDRGNLLTGICNNLNLPLPHVTENDVATITVSIEAVKPKTGSFVVEAKTKNDTRDPFDRTPQELKNWVRGVIWRDQHFSGMTIRQIAQESGCSDSLVASLITKGFTAA